MIRALTLALLPAALIGCASPPPEAPTTVAAAGKDLMCDKEIKTGSMMPATRCRTAEQRAADQRAVEEAADLIKQGRQKIGPLPM